MKAIMRAALILVIFAFTHTANGQLQRSGKGQLQRSGKITLYTPDPSKSNHKENAKGTSSPEYHKKYMEMTPEERKASWDKRGRSVIQRSSKSAYNANSERARNRKIQRRKTAVEQAKIQQENQAAYEAQARRERVYYDTVVRPQELKEAELRYQKMKDIAEYRQREESLQLQRNRNWILFDMQQRDIQRLNFQRQYGFTPRRIYYGVQPYGIRLPY